MQVLSSDEMILIRGGSGGYDPNMTTEPTDPGDGGGCDVGGGYVIEQQTIDNLNSVAATGSDADVTTAAENTYHTASFDGFNPGSGAYYLGGGGGSPPPSFRDIYNSIPGVPKDKVKSLKGPSFKIC